jgi:ATP-dependent RNA circularization protein (DNA/RNA ligase family)
MSDFFRFPHTPHIAWLGQGQPRDDKVLAPEEARAFLQVDIIIEEKVDGANLGFSLSPQGEIRAQNRGHYLERPFSGQFSRLETWLSHHEDSLIDALSGRLMLFGEWCAARHSLGYERLPDFFIAFDVYDTNTSRFYSAERRNAFVRKLDIALVPRIGRGRFSLAQLVDSLEKAHSSFRDGELEGYYLRRDGAQWLESRAKLVKPGFTQAIGGHWSKRGIEWNGVVYSSLSKRYSRAGLLF